MNKSKDSPAAPMHGIVLCVAVLLLISCLLTSSYIWCHAMGWRSTRVVDEIHIEKLDDRYTIPATQMRKMIAFDGSPFFDYWWEPAKDIHYERWTIKAVDGFEIVINRVDPMDPPEICDGDRYTGWWK